MTGSAAAPAAFEAIREEFLAVEPRERLLLLLEFADDLPPLPARFGEHPELLERVTECQAPVFVVAEVGEDGVHVHAQAPAEAPTTRGFASVLAHGFEGLDRETALAVPDDFPDTLGLAGAVSLLRLRGMAGLLARIKRQLRAA